MEEKELSWGEEPEATMHDLEYEHSGAARLVSNNESTTRRAVLGGIGGSVALLGSGGAAISEDSQTFGSAMYPSLKALLADLPAGYSRAEGVIVKAGAFLYEVAAPNVSDQHMTTATGVKLYYLPSGSVKLEALNIIAGTDSDQRTQIKTAFELAEDCNLPIQPCDGFYTIRTAGAASAIKLKKCPTIKGVLRIRWVLQDGTNKNKIFDISGINGLSPVSRIANSPLLKKHSRALTLATGLNLSPGNWIAIQAGEDPSDDNERHWNVVTRVVSYDSETGGLLFADGAPYDISYGKKNDIVIYKLDHNPIGGEMNLSIDFSSMGANRPGHPVIIRFCRQFQISVWEEFQTDFGLALGPGCTDVQIGAYRVVQTADQAESRDPRHGYGPWNSNRVNIGQMHVSVTVEPRKALAAQLEAHARDHNIVDFTLDAELPTEPTQPIFKISGGSSLHVFRAYVRSNQITTLHTFGNRTGEERFTCGDLRMDGEGVVFDPSVVLGQIEKVDEEYEFGPLETFEYELSSRGNNIIAYPLGDMIVAGVKALSGTLTNGFNSIELRCAEEPTVRQFLSRDADGVWVRTVLSSPNVYWAAGGGRSRLNRMDLMRKELFVDANKGGTVLIRILGRRVDGNQF